MQTRLYIELIRECETHLYSLPFYMAELPLGAHIPVKGDILTFFVLKPQLERELLEPRNFEVADRWTYMQCKLDDGMLYLAEVTLKLRDLGSGMTNARGLGALGEADPVYIRKRQSS